MKKRTKKIIIVTILLIIAIILIFNLIVYLDSKIGIDTYTVFNVYDNKIVKLAVPTEYEVNYNLNDVIVKDLNLKQLDLNKVNVGDYIYLYIKEKSYSYYCTSSNYYCKVNAISNNSIDVEIQDWRYYSFDSENTTIKDINGNKISAEDLKKGDTIKVFNINPKYTPSIVSLFEGYSEDTIYDVKSAKIIGRDDETIKKIDNRNFVAIKEAFVAGVNKDNIYVVDSENQNLLYQVSFAKEGNIGFKVGQEVMIYFNGKDSSTGNNGISEIQNVGKIEIIDSSSNHLISNDILKKFNTTFNNVEVNVENITNTGITFTITDKNDIKYNFDNNYDIFKNVAEKPSNEPIIGEDGSMSMPAYEGDKWQELFKVSDNIENKANIENIDENTKRYTFDWSNIYGPLKSGEYRFVLGDIEVKSNYLVIRNNIESISAKFEVDDNGKISDLEIEKGV